MCLRIPTDDPETDVRSCIDLACSEDQACFVYAVSGEPYRQMAELLDLCLPRQDCIEAATVLPGGGACFDEATLLAGSLAPPYDPYQCPEAGNPLFGSCFDAFLHGCYAPDGTGTCNDDGSELTWSDGHALHRDGETSELFAPAASASCIRIEAVGDESTWIRDDVALVLGTTGATVTLTCPDGSTVEATQAQLEHYERCRGIACP
jgi:hypothetical protein